MTISPTERARRNSANISGDGIHEAHEVRQEEQTELEEVSVRTSHARAMPTVYQQQGRLRCSNISVEEFEGEVLDDGELHDGGVQHIYQEQESLQCSNISVAGHGGGSASTRRPGKTTQQWPKDLAVLCQLRLDRQPKEGDPAMAERPRCFVPAPPRPGRHHRAGA